MVYDDGSEAFTADAFTDEARDLTPGSRSTTSSPTP